LKKIAILQSNYIPWKGYFDMINMVDEFVLYDCVQYTKNDWRNRNLIKTPNGVQWLTIPCRVESLHQRIDETKVSDKSWANKHLKSIIQNYSRAKYFKEYIDIFEALYKEMADEEYLSNINYKFLTTINDILGIKTKISKCQDFTLIEGQTSRLVRLCQDTNADIYISGPAAKNYLDESLFEKAGIKVEWMDYSGYKEYNQLFGEFTHGVSIIDLIFNEGSNAAKYMKSFGEKR
jgi:hypothetical protein